MKNIKFTLEYEGTRYDGWQRQGNTGNTIQGKLEAVLSRMVGKRWRFMVPAEPMRVSMPWGRWPTPSWRQI